MAKWAFVQDRFLPEEEALLPVSDLAIQRGYGIFDFFRTCGGQPVYLDDHLARFFHSAAHMHLPLPYTADALKEILSGLMQRNNLPDSGIRITLTGGPSPDGYRLAEPSLVITQQPLSVQAVQDAYPDGLRLVTYEHQRQLPQVKTIDYLMGIWLQPYILDKEADDVLYHRMGVVTECPRANFFIVTEQNELLTPSEHILKGITRKHVLSLAGRHMQVREGTLTLDHLRTAREAFITSTTKLILPVARVDGHVLPAPASGSLAAFLRKELECSVAGQESPQPF